MSSTTSGPRWYHPYSLTPFAPIVSAWRHRRLIVRLARRDVEARYRGSTLGLLWTLVTPLLMLAVYTFVFSVVFQSRWGTASEGQAHFALILFSGLMAYNLFAECINRAPGLMLENLAYIKKVVFPLEILPWVCLLASFINFLISFLAFLAFYIAIIGTPPWQIAFLPLLWGPILLISVGLTWVLSSLGVFLRDIRQLVGIFTTMLLFLTPVFYPLSGVPHALRNIIYLNPLTLILEGIRDVLFVHTLPNWEPLVLLWAFSMCVAWLGMLWFMRTKRGFADVA